MKNSISILFLLLFLTSANAQIEYMQKKILDIISSKNAVVGISIIGPSNEEINFNNSLHFPMQSVFKFHIALVVLSEVDKGNLSLEQKIKFEKEELLPNTWSPIRDRYPEGCELTLAEIIYYTVSISDNNGCDKLLKILGGTEVVNDFFIKNNFVNISIVANEEEMHQDWDTQFLNWTTPYSANLVLKSFYEKKLLSENSTKFLLDIMINTITGKKRIVEQLPEGTIVAHKTGSSGTNENGITAAVNDIGIVFLPDGNVYYLSVFVTGSSEDYETNEKIISDISIAVWDYFNNK